MQRLFQRHPARRITALPPRLRPSTIRHRRPPLPPPPPRMAPPRRRRPNTPPPAGVAPAAAPAPPPAAAAAAAADGPTAPPPAFTINGSVTLISDYRFRGISQTNLQPAIQGSLTLTHSSGFYASV